MLLRILHSVFAGLLFTASLARADFLPPNDLWKEDGLLRGATLTEKDFNEVIDLAESVIGDIVSSNFGATLKVNRLWTDSTVNANAIQYGNDWEVNMYGGLARRPEITRDGFGLVLCHEIGHHLGGYPFSSSWAANEGSADYFTTIACPRIIWKEQLKTNASFRKIVEATPKSLCDRVWKTEVDQNLCYRVTMGGKSLADLLSALGGTKASWSTPDTSKVSVTNNAHPAGQCRLDTYLAGALCAKDFDTAVIPAKDLGSKRNTKDGELNAVASSCTQYENFELGFRPTCWFKPFLTTTK